MTNLQNQISTTNDVCNVLSGPILTVSQEQKAIRFIIQKMLALAKEYGSLWDIDDVDCWMEVADALKIEWANGNHWRGTCERLIYKAREDCYIIEYDPKSSPRRQVHVFVHEIAHWFLKKMDPIVLCGVVNEAVFYFEGCIDDKHHRMAREIEEDILGLRRAILMLG